MSIDHSVLNKRGRLDDREFAEMVRHTTLGYEILSGYPRLAMASEIAHAHHEMVGGRRLSAECSGARRSRSPRGSSPSRRL